MLTYTGLSITPDSIQSPICQDIGVAMGRITRYGGAIWCPLIFHSLLVAALIPETASDDTWAGALIHEACEVVTGEVPFPWKTDQVANREKVLSAVIAEYFNVVVRPEDVSLIKAADLAALYGEAESLASLAWRKAWLERYEPGAVANGWPRPSQELITRSKAIAATLKLRGFADPSRTCNPESGQVKNFITLLEALKAGQTKRARLALASTLAKPGAVAV